MMTASRIQHSVGQGFFHSGRLLVADVAFRYVYDCGSLDFGSVHQEVDRYIDMWEVGQINALFVSHLDVDHISGLDHLLALVSVHTVFLPYLTAADCLFFTSSAISEGTPTVDYLRLIAHPARWFADRGVSRVVFVRPDGGTPEPPESEVFVDLPATEVLLTPDVIEHPHHRLGELPSSGGGKTRVFQIGHSLPLTIQSDEAQLLDWMLVTFVHPPEPEVHDTFLLAVRDAFGDIPDNTFTHADEFCDWLCNLLRSRKARGTLSKCYESLAKDRNVTSMSLYSGPIRTRPDFASMHAVFDFVSAIVDRLPLFPELDRAYMMRSSNERSQILLAPDHAAGWLGTGDINLSIGYRRDALISHFAAMAEQISTVSLPHHGSRRSFHKSILFPNARFFVASAGENSRYGHPSDEVRDAVTAQGRMLITVTQLPSTSFVEKADIVQREGEAVSLLPYIKGNAASRF